MTTRPVLLVKSGGEAAMPEWRRHIGEAAPGLDIRWWDDPEVDSAAVHYVLVWEPEPGRLARLPNLRLILSDAAGVGHILRDPDLPPGVPIVRMVSVETAQRMGEYACLACLALLRDLPRSIANQRARLWEEFTPDRTAQGTRVGVMGMGQLGRRAAEMLAAIGFRVAGWSASRKISAEIESFAGEADLSVFLARSDIVVNLLPETPATRAILRAETLALLPPGAGVVNAGRASHVVLADLLAALDRGRLRGAVLDVFGREPLPADDPAWTHPRVIVTAHGAAYDTLAGRARQAAATILADQRGETPPHLYDPRRGY